MLLGEASTGGMIAVSIAPVWYNQLWYPSLLRPLMNYPTLLPPVQDILIGPEVQSHSVVLQVCLPLVAWPISRDPTTPRDFRRKLLSLSENLGGPHLSQPTLPPGVSGIAGASDGVLRDILEILLTQFQAGKQYHTINTLRSTISMTHMKVDGVPVGQHPLVSRLLKGVFNSRPPAPQYLSTWDVTGVLTHFEKRPENNKLSFQALTHKVAMLMALNNADRCFNLAALDLNHCSYQTNSVRFIITGLII